MLVYILNYLLIPILNGVCKNKKKFVYSIMFFLFLLLAFRSNMLGDDLDNYSMGYDYIADLSFFDLISRLRLISLAKLTYPLAYESGFVVFMWLIAAATGLGFHAFLVAHAAFCCISFAKFINKYSMIPWLSLCMFMSFQFYEYSFGILRQTLAVAILLYSIPMIQEKKLGRFLLICFLAFTMHRLSIIFVPMYFLSNIRIRKTMIRKILLAYMLLFVSMPYIYNLVLIKLLAFFGKTSYVIDIKLTYNNLVALFILIFVLTALFADFETFFDKNNNLICWGVILAIPVLIMGSYAPIFSRAAEVYSIYIITLIPNVLASYKQVNKHVNVVRTGKALVFFLLLGFMVYNLSDSMIVPYVGYWR